MDDTSKTNELSQEIDGLIESLEVDALKQLKAELDSISADIEKRYGGDV